MVDGEQLGLPEPVGIGILARLEEGERDLGRTVADWRTRTGPELLDDQPTVPARRPLLVHPRRHG